MAGHHCRIQRWTPILPRHCPAPTKGLGGMRRPTAPSRHSATTALHSMLGLTYGPSAAPASSAGPQSPHLPLSPLQPPGLPLQEVGEPSHSLKPQSPRIVSR